MKKSLPKVFASILNHLVMFLLIAIWLLPIIWIILASFKEGQGFVSTSFFPESFTFANYQQLFVETAGIKFVKWVSNTLVIAISNMFLTTLFTIITAYTLSRFRFKGRKSLMNIALVLGMFPGFMAMVAVYLILNLLGLIGNIFALLLVYVAGAGLGFFVSKGYFDTISKDIDEAAMIDGANQWQIFFKVFLPLAKPIIIYTALMAFMAPWTDFILAGLILRDPESMTVAVGLYNMTLENRISTQFTMFAAGCMLIAIPIVGFYLSLQRFMIEGISVGAVKG
jgi:arabinogalactan oligomer/maltooligosaccharide transport system permease protein